MLCIVKNRGVVFSLISSLISSNSWEQKALALFAMLWTVFGVNFKYFFRLSQRDPYGIGHSRHQHHFVGLLDTCRIDFSHTQELGECPENRFYRGLSLAFHIPALFTLHPGNCPFIFFFIVGNRYPPFTAFPDACCFQRTIFTIIGFGQVQPFTIKVLPFYDRLSKDNFLALAAQPVVTFFVISKSFRASFVSSMRWL